MKEESRWEKRGSRKKRGERKKIAGGRKEIAWRRDGEGRVKNQREEGEGEVEEGGESYINVFSMHFRCQIMIAYVLLPVLTRGCEGSLGELCKKLLER